MRMPRRRSALALVAAAALTGGLGVAGCGSSSSSGDSSSTASATAPASSPAASATATVGMEGVSFTPDSASVKVGGTVTWKNTSQISHNVTGDGYVSKTLDPGATFKHTFAKAGTYDFLCTFHAGMKGTITVQ